MNNTNNFNFKNKGGNNTVTFNQTNNFSNQTVTQPKLEDLGAKVEKGIPLWLKTIFDVTAFFAAATELGEKLKIKRGAIKQVFKFIFSAVSDSSWEHQRQFLGHYILIIILLWFLFQLVLNFHLLNDGNINFVFHDLKKHRIYYFKKIECGFCHRKIRPAVNRVEKYEYIVYCPECRKRIPTTIVDIANMADNQNKKKI